MYNTDFTVSLPLTEEPEVNQNNVLNPHDGKKNIVYTRNRQNWYDSYCSEVKFPIEQIPIVQKYCSKVVCSVYFDGNVFKSPFVRCFALYDPVAYMPY